MKEFLKINIKDNVCLLYTSNPLYFAKRINDIKMQGATILGGCCGTNPSYTEGISKIIKKKSIMEAKVVKEIKENNNKADKVLNTFKNKLENKKFVVAVELTAPVDTNVTTVSYTHLDVYKRQALNLLKK